MGNSASTSSPQGADIPTRRAPESADTAGRPPSEAAEPAVGAEGGSDAAGASPHPHDFETQKRIHRRIRNDPDYDDWDYGTEPLPHEAWRSAGSAGKAGNAG